MPAGRGWGVGGAPRWELCKMEATLGLVYTAQQMAAGAPDCTIVKIPQGTGPLCLDDVTSRPTVGRGLSTGLSPPRALPSGGPATEGPPERPLHV